MKKQTFAILLALIASGAMAQNFEGRTIEERIAHSTGNNEDSIKTAKGYITMFQQAGANKDYSDMYIDYKWLKNYVLSVELSITSYILVIAFSVNIDFSVPTGPSNAPNTPSKITSPAELPFPADVLADANAPETRPGIASAITD